MTDQKIQSDIINKQLPDCWIETTLGNIVKTNISSVGNSFEFDEILYLDTGSITEGKIELLQKLNIFDAPSRAKRLVKEKDIIYSTVRPNQKHFGFIQAPEENLVVSTGFTVITTDEKKSDAKFLYYFLTQDSITNTLQQTAEHSTSTYPSIRPEHIEDLDISLPPLPEQQAIAAVFSSFDDKIELLREQNKTFEQTAQMIFQEWFGKYKVNGEAREGTLGCGVDDELPEGWRVGKLGEEFNVSIGRTPPRGESQWFSNIPIGKKWISIKDIGNCGVYIFNTSEYLTDESIKKFNIPVIPENTTILSFKMTVGKLTITTEEMLSNEAIAHLKIKDNSCLTSEFIYCYLQALDFNSLGSTSSIVTAINSTMIKEIEVIVPDEIILGKFNSIIKPIFEKIKNNSKQIQSLSQTRDELLPRLMRGEVRVDF